MLDVRLARLGLPLPLEPAIGRALMHRERAAQHEGLVLAWELAIRILAGSLWAACRHASLSSTALERVTAKLDRPSMGHWVELARTCAGLLRESNHPAAAAFRTTLDGLESSLPAECGLRALSQRIAELPDAPPRPRRVQEALDQLPHYRNCAQSTHKDVGPAFREASVQPLLEGLVDFCERVPLIGAYSLVLVGRLESRARGGSAELARLHGTFPSWSQREIPESVWPSLVSSRPYLFLEPDLAVPLFPMAAVTNSGAEWHVGWYARQVHVPTVAYQGAGGHEFQIVLAPDEIESLVRGAQSGSEVAANTAALQLEPYRGLLAYDEEHAAIFFGREEETEAALARIEELGALFIFGASGSGKSSWMRAGIVPALRARAALAGRRLLPIVLVPGDRPLAALRRALTLARGGSPEEAAAWARAVDEAIPPTPSAANPSKSSASSERGLAHLLRGLASQGSLPALVVDQMEEAATLALDRDEGRAFLALVASAAASAKDVGAVVLASARADLLAPLLEHESVRRFLEVNGAPVGSIPPERLARVIVEPLRGRKVPLEAGLAETILADVANEPGSLALLSQVLTTVWSERARFGGALTKQGYVDAGRVSGALERQAEAALTELAARSPDAGRRVDRLFRALATSDEGERFTRRRVKLDALASELGATPVEVRETAAPFVTRRLVVLDGVVDAETVEVAHERLLVAWPRLANLLASEREVLELRSDIEIAAAAWHASGGRRELWTDSTSKLRRGEELLASGRLDLDTRGRSFLSASRTSVRRRKRFERGVLTAMVLLVLAAAYGIWSARRATAREATLKNAAFAREREEQLRALLPAVEYFESLDDDLDYAHSQRRPTHEWWIERANALLDGVAADPVAGHPSRPGLRDVDHELETLRASARQRTPVEVERDRAMHPRREEYEYLRDYLPQLRRTLDLDEWPSEREVEASLSRESLPQTAQELMLLAHSQSRSDNTQHMRSLLLAQRALAIASNAETPRIQLSIAGSLMNCGRLDDSLALCNLLLTQGPREEDRHIPQVARAIVRAIEFFRNPATPGELAEQLKLISSRLDLLSKSMEAQRTWTFDEHATSWRHEELCRLQAARIRIDSQLSFAHASVREASAVSKWEQALRAIEASELYRDTKWPGTKLQPQLGLLLPIGPDPDSGLWEFAHLASGNPAQRDSKGRILLSAATGIVLVLLPAGRVPCAAQSFQQEATLCGVVLDSFLISKYEVTSAQWDRLGGFNKGPDFGRTLDPAVDMNWNDCNDTCTRVGWLRLPTEAQWEYGCRAGSTTTYWPGDDPEMLRDVANMWFGELQPDVVRIGTLRANPFGLHDVHGNVAEWCMDYHSQVDRGRRPGDGLSEGPPTAERVVRGGMSSDGQAYMWSSLQLGSPPDERWHQRGVRPVMRISP